MTHLFRAALAALSIAAVLAGSPEASAQAAGRPIGIMTTNLWHKDHPQELEVVANHLRRDLRKVPDFILCQEVVFNRAGRFDDTAEVLAANLGYYSHGTKRRGDREGIAIVSRYPFDFYDTIEYDAQTTKLLLGFRRLSAMGEFVVPGVGRVRVVNVHLTNWGFERHIRDKQIAETLAWVERRQRQVPAAATFLGGDFNAEIGDAEMAQIRNPGPGRMAYLNFNTDRPSKGSPGKPKTRIDLIFVHAPTVHAQLLEERLVWREGLRDEEGDRFHISDHLAVSHTYQLTAPQPALARSQWTQRPQTR